MKLSSDFARLTMALPLVIALTPVTQENGVQQWLAKLPSGKPVTGEVFISQGPGGNGIGVQATFAGLPSTGGPFLYHIHERALSPDGNCSSAGPHLSPFTSEYPCPNFDHPENCEAGDLSGKHGKINGTEHSANYADDYVSNNDSPGCGQCMTGRSLVVHFANKTGIACANFTLIGSTGSSTVTTISGAASTITQSGSAPASGSPTPQTVTSTFGGDASHPTAAALAAAFAGMAALLV